MLYYCMKLFGGFFIFLACSEPRCSSCSKSPFQCESCKTGFFQFSSNGNETVKCLDKCPLGYQPFKKNGTVFCEKEPTPGKLERAESDTFYAILNVYDYCWGIYM